MTDLLSLEQPETLPEVSAADLADWGRTLVVAPHPDDESLGCGGTIALLRELRQQVFVLVMSDGTLSHPNSQKYPPARLRALRENELRAALEILGVPATHATFLRYCDRSVPDKDASEFAAAVEICRRYLENIQPQIVLLPWRRDPHPDHRAAYQILFAAAQNARLPAPLKFYEYPIWLWEIAASEDAPRACEVEARRVDISRVADKKLRAVAAHVSQITGLIDDDPEGFRLTPEILRHFARPLEIYFESRAVETLSAPRAANL